MRVRHSLAVASCLAVLLVLLAGAMAVEARLSAVWRVALDSIDDPAEQERDEAAPANAPSAHHGDEAVTGVVLSLVVLERLIPSAESSAADGARPLRVSRAPPAR